MLVVFLLRAVGWGAVPSTQIGQNVADRPLVVHCMSAHAGRLGRNQDTTKVVSKERGCAGTTTMVQFPVVDISTYATKKAEVSQELAKAASDIGFFYVTGVSGGFVLWTLLFLQTKSSYSSMQQSA